MTPFSQRYGPWAVVAGASEGLGAAFAKGLARRGLSVLLVARRVDKLQGLADELRGLGVQAQVLAVDLSHPTAAEHVLTAAQPLDVGLLVFNAALAPRGRFLELSVQEQCAALELNGGTLLALTHGLAQRMAAAKRGGVVLMSSLTAFQGSPFLATYGATKSFILSLAEALWFELGPVGVDVLGVCAGATRTPNFERSAPNGAPGLLEPEQVVEEALAALGTRPLLIPGGFNRAASFALRRLISRRAAVRIMGQEGQKLLPPRVD